MRLSYLVVLLLLFLSLSGFSDAHEEDVIADPPYQCHPIKNVSEPHVVDIAEYAVTEFNKRSGEKLKLEKILEGEYQDVALLTTNYRLALKAKDACECDDIDNYQAIVQESRWPWPWESFLNLTSFKPLPHQH